MEGVQQILLHVAVVINAALNVFLMLFRIVITSYRSGF